MNTVRPPSRATATRGREIGPLIDAIADADFFALREPAAVAAITALRRLGEPAAAALGSLLRHALALDGMNWLAVHRPLYVLEGMGRAARPALPELVAALEVGPPLNALLAARVIGHMGRAARTAAPALRQAANQWREVRGVPKSIADALTAIGAV
jgi:hypothetical protein